MIRHHARLLRVALLAALAATAPLTLACGTQSASGPPKWDSRSVGESIKRAPFTPVIVNSNIGRGPTRLALALLRQDQTLVIEGQVTAEVYRIDNEPEKNPATGTVVGTYNMVIHVIDTADHSTMRFDRDDGAHVTRDVALRDDTTPDERALPAHDGAMSAIFTTMIDFKEAGMYGARLQVKTGGKTVRNLLLTFAVLERTAEPSVGDPAPRTKQKIAKDVSDLSELDSSAKPNPSLHDITVADAIDSGKPALVAFVTPAFCQTRFCGPVLNNVIIPAQQQYQGRVHVIHIEPYDLVAARKGTLTAVPAAVEWNLRAEPFIAVIDGQGRVSAKFEGIIDLDEVKQALDAALAAR
ncbi:MAG: hypothetical protein WC273_07265 [Dehalococcoidia bacterium]